MKLGNLVVALVLSLGVAVGCSSEDTSKTSTTPTPTTPCNENPWQCADNQTCWLNQVNSKLEFACLNAAAGVQVGTECLSQVGAPSCGSAQVCLQLAGQTKGTCSSFCDPKDSTKACATGEVCAQVQIPGATGTFMACAKTGTSGAGGAAGMSGMAGAAGGETAGSAGESGQAGMAGTGGGSAGAGGG
jgi:hypothetical protein